MQQGFEAIDLSKYEYAVGPALAAQLALKLFMDDLTNMNDSREQALAIYQWLGNEAVDIDTAITLSPEKANFILKAMEKYQEKLNLNVIDPNTFMNYFTAMDSLKYQRELRKR